MVQTKQFLLMVIALIVFLLWVLILSISIEKPQSQVPTETVIMAEPRDFYSVEYEAVDEGYMRRAIFIEKVRSTLLSDPVPEPILEPVVEYGVPEPTLPTTTIFSSSSMSLPIH